MRTLSIEMLSGPQWLEETPRWPKHAFAICEEAQRRIDLIEQERLRSSLLTKAVEHCSVLQISHKFAETKYLQVWEPKQTARRWGTPFRLLLILFSLTKLRSCALETVDDAATHWKTTADQAPLAKMNSVDRVLSGDRGKSSLAEPLSEASERLAHRGFQSDFGDKDFAVFPALGPLFGSCNPL